MSGPATFQITNLDEEVNVLSNDDFQKGNWVPEGTKYVTSTMEDGFVAVCYSSDAIRFVKEYESSLDSQQENVARALQNMLLDFLKREGRLIDDDMPPREDWSTLPLMDPPEWDELEYYNLQYDIIGDEPQWDWREPATPY